MRQYHLKSASYPPKKKKYSTTTGCIDTIMLAESAIWYWDRKVYNTKSMAKTRVKLGIKNNIENKN